MTSLPSGIYIGLTVLGFFGLLGMTVFFPLAAGLLPPRRFRGSHDEMTSAPTLAAGIDFLIPAHNEAGALPATIASVKSAIAHFGVSHRGFTARILVGADACTDETAARARTLGADVREYPENRSKWRTLGDLLGESRAPWVALVDAGAIWSPELLDKLHAAQLAVEARHGFPVSGLAPTYLPKKGGRMERAHWKTERFLKTLECRFGSGPVSVHGASVFYRRSEALAGYAWLGQTSPRQPWLNDDVALPLALRWVSPGARIESVADAAVSDEGLQTHSGSIEGRRRRRMARGNAQWIRTLWPRILLRDPRTAVVAMRRVFRWIWAWWAVFFTVGALGMLHAPEIQIFGILVAGALLAAIILPRPLAAALAALAAPIELVRRQIGDWS